MLSFRLLKALLLIVVLSFQPALLANVSHYLTSDSFAYATPNIQLYSSPGNFTTQNLELDTSKQTIKILFTKPVEGFFAINVTVTRTMFPRFPGRRQFTVEVPLLLVVEVKGAQAEISLPSGFKSFAVLGPFSREVNFVPYVLSLDENSLAQGLVIEWPVEYGGRVILETLPSLSGELPIFTVETNYTPILENSMFRILSPKEQLALGAYASELYFMSNSIILPPDREVELTVHYEIDGFRGTIIEHVAARLNETLRIATIAERIFASNNENLQRVILNLTANVRKLEENGYYLGSTNILISQAVEQLKLKEGDRLRVSIDQKLAFTLLMEISERLARIATGPSPWYTIFLLVVGGIASFLMACLFFSEKGKRVTAFLALVVTLTLAAYSVTPGLTVSSEAAAVTTAAAGLTLVGLGVVKVVTVRGVRTASGASLEGLASSIFNFAVNFFSKRRARATLMLLMVTAVSAGLTCLTSFAAYSSLSYQEAGWVSQFLGKTFLIARGLSPAGPLNPLGLGFISGREGVTWVAPNALALFPMNPIETLQGVPISGIIGVSRGSPVLELLKGTLIAGAVEDVCDRGKVIVSDLVAKRTEKSVGDVISIQGVEFTIVGVFDSRKFSQLKDLDGEDLIPTVVFGMSATKVAPESTIVVNYMDSLLLGANTNKVYVELSDRFQSDELAESLSVLGGYTVYVSEPGEIVRVYYPGTRLEIRGGEMVVPAVIALLMLFLSFIGFVYELRREVYTLSTLGATPDQLSVLFITGACIVGFAGGVTGYMLGLAVFRMFHVFNLQVPVDAKVDLPSAVFSVLASIVISIFGSLQPAMRAVLLAVPSLKRRWTPESEVVGREDAERAVELVTTIPVVIRDSQEAESFTKFVASRLEEMRAHKVSVFNVEVFEESFEQGRNYKVYFEYAQVEGRAFKSYNTIAVKKTDKYYTVELHSRVVTIFTSFANQCLRDVASLVRELALQWSARSGRVALFIRSSQELVKEAVTLLSPRYLLVFTPEDSERLKKILDQSLKRLGYRAALEVRSLSQVQFEKVPYEVKDKLQEVDIVYINSDDKSLSSLALKAAKESGVRALSRGRGGELIEVA
ncbi:MAG: ABC transporter permease [Thermofilaceae archaeon]